MNAEQEADFRSGRASLTDSQWLFGCVKEWKVSLCVKICPQGFYSTIRLTEREKEILIEFRPIQTAGLVWQSPADKDTVVALFCRFLIYYPVLSFLLLIAVSLSCICCIDLFSFHPCTLIIFRPLWVWLMDLGFDWQVYKARLWRTDVVGFWFELKVIPLSGGAYVWICYFKHTHTHMCVLLCNWGHPVDFYCYLIQLIRITIECPKMHLIPKYSNPTFSFLDVDQDIWVSVN